MADFPQAKDSSSLLEKKRTRVQLSCTACRSRKLKCCRTHPCTNCMKRGEAASCTFVGRGPRGRASQGMPSPSHVHDRLQHLENLIRSLAQKKQQEEYEIPEVPEPHTDVEPKTQQISPPLSSLPALDGKDSPVDQPGKLIMKDAGPSYIDAAHWTAILEEINEVKESLRESDEGLDEDTIEDDSNDNAPTILFGLSKPVTREELLGDIPPRPVTDRLVSVFLNCKEPLIVVIHIPTFQSEYNLFWSRPQDVSLPWLGLLYAILTMATLIQRRRGECVQASPEDPSDILGTFMKRSAQCLVQSNYTTPGRYKVEGLLMHIMGEFYRSNDAQVGVSFLFAITIKLAMRMGYHRDPQHFPAISAFDGEMRRRVWCFLFQFDILLSFQTGFPRTLQGWQHDVELPRNLTDDDYNEMTKHLPPSRPENEATITSFMRAKFRLMNIFGEILDLAYSREPVTYEQTLMLDRRLGEAHDLIPPLFQIRPTDQSIADPSELIFRRYRLQLTYQKARCVLHRRYLGEAHSNLRYAYSRAVCLGAAKEILRCQTDLFYESQPGGLMSGNRSFSNSIHHGDCLLAAMILCMELSYNRAAENQAKGYTNDVSVVVTGHEDILSTLEMSCRIFEMLRQQSTDAQKGYEALTVMLRRVKGGAQKNPKSPIGPSGNEPLLHTINAQPPAYAQLEDSMTATNIPNVHLGVIGDMLDTPANLDWQIWDEQIQGLDDHSGDNMWYFA